MKKGFFSCVAIATLMVFLSAGSVFAAENSNTGFYVGVSGGYVIPQSMTFSDPDSGTRNADVDLKNGYLFGLTGGYIVPSTKRIMAVEIEYNYIFGTNLDKDETGSSLDGDVSMHALLFNVKARYPEGRFHPYAGFGLGWSFVEVGDIKSGGYVASGQSGNAFCWQFLAGLDYDINPNLAVGLGYKYFATKPTIGSSGDDLYSEADYKASIVTIGLTYAF